MIEYCRCASVNIHACAAQCLLLKVSSTLLSMPSVNFLTSCRLLIQLQHQCWSRLILLHHSSPNSSIAHCAKVSFRLRLKKTIMPVLKKPDNLKLSCSLTALRTLCCLSADGSISHWLISSASPIWFSTWPFHWNCHAASALRYSLGCWLWWPSCSGPSGPVSSVWYSRSLYSVEALATDLPYWRHSSRLVSVVPIIQETVCASRSQQVLSFLFGLRYATLVHPGPNRLRPVYGRSL